MSEQRIDKAAEAATTSDADPGEGMGLASAGAHPGGIHSGGPGVAGMGTGERGEVQLVDPDAPPPEDEQGATEGKRSAQRATQQAEADRPLEESGHAD